MQIILSLLYLIFSQIVLLCLLLLLSSKIPLLWYTGDSDILVFIHVLKHYVRSIIYKIQLNILTLRFSYPGIPVLPSCILILYTLPGWWKTNSVRSKLNSPPLFFFTQVETSWSFTDPVLFFTTSPTPQKHTHSSSDPISWYSLPSFPIYLYTAPTVIF